MRAAIVLRRGYDFCLRTSRPAIRLLRRPRNPAFEIFVISDKLPLEISAGVENPHCGPPRYRRRYDFVETVVIDITDGHVHPAFEFFIISEKLSFEAAAGATKSSLADRRRYRRPVMISSKPSLLISPRHVHPAL